jgi:glyoxylase-like metal-dependent hydrolase (beta-lactamase superfamily II)
MALESLARLERLAASWVLPGHGAPWSGGIAEAVGLVRAASAGGSA